LGYAHSQGLIHRDIKPANIMLTKRGEAVVTDFGIAQIVGETRYTVSGALMGTLSYMAPEQGLQGLCDQRSDLYSLGIVFYEMLTGFTPFDGDTPLAILLKHLHDPLPLPRQIDPALPESLEKIVLKALEKDPANRYQSCQEMTDALAQISPEEVPEGARDALNPASGYGPKAVFSGTSRQKISDLHLASQDTDPDLTPPAPQPGSSLSLPRPLNVTGAVLAGLSAILLINFFASMLTSASGINIYQRGWPFELFLLAGFLAVLMWAVETPWLLIPIFILLGNALLLAYSAISGRWADWVFLWMLEPLIIGAAIYTPIVLKKKRAQLSSVTRGGGALLSLLSILLAGATCALTLAAAALRSLP
jgi:serine/threonine protein kinase